MKWTLGILLCLAVAPSAPAAVATGKYRVIVDRLFALQNRFARVSRIFSIGKNDEGVDIYAIRVSHTPGYMDHGKVGHILVSTHHGNEPDTPEFTLAFLENLLERYSQPEALKNNLASTEYYVIPVLNISGYNTNVRREYGKDPNRVYPGPCTPNPVERLKSTDNVMRFLSTRIFAGSVTIHGYLTSLTYPWGFFADDYKSKDDAQYDYLIRKAAEHNGYPAGNGALVLYPANGCYEDYVYWKHGSWSMLVEIDSGDEDDNRKTVPAVAAFFDLINRSPSKQNQFTGRCVPAIRSEARSLE
jgi:hypothetical protein